MEYKENKNLKYYIVCYNVFLKAIDISMETINNRDGSIDFFET